METLEKQDICQSTLIYAILAIITTIIINIIIIYRSREITPVSVLFNLAGITLTVLFIEYICSKSVTMAWIMFVLLVMSLIVNLINFLVF